jgi:hypothetical protein
MGRAFPPHAGCPVPSMSAITGILVSSCQIDPPADPIYSFPIFAMPIPNPPSYNFGCYRPIIHASALTNQVVPFFSAILRFPHSSVTGNCQPDFRFNVGFPASNCPDISASAKIKIIPAASPSISLKVSKSPGACNFNFKLDIGIPGGTCTSVNLEETDLPPFVLHNGDSFFVDTIVDISKSTDGACALYTLKFNDVKITLDTTTVMGLTPHNDPIVKPCCTDITVVSGFALGWTYPVVGGLVQPTLNYDTIHINIPKTKFGVDDPSATTLACNGTFTAAVGLNISDDAECAPCGELVSLLTTTFTLTPPTVEEFDDGTINDLSDTGATIHVLTGIDTGSTPCDVKLSREVIKAGGRTTTVVVVCDVTCVGSPTPALTVKHQTLTFKNGILTDEGTCA